MENPGKKRKDPKLQGLKPKHLGGVGGSQITRVKNKL